MVGRVNGVNPAERCAGEIRLLGPVEVHPAAGAPARLPPAVRALLARLALAPRRVVSTDSLTDALWGEELPADAANSLQLRVSKLRRALARAGLSGDLVVTRPPGYLLDVDRAAVDVERFEALAASARSHAAQQRSSDAISAWEEALSLWRGTPLADVADLPWVGTERDRLDELHVSAHEERLELLVDVGRHDEAVTELEHLAAAHPLRERVHRSLMLALYRAGRQAAALAAYHRLREHLADELGIDPSPDVQALNAAILRQQVPSPSTRQSATTPVQPDDAGPPRGLPTRLFRVLGREGDVASLTECLRASRLVTLTGPGGVGKTTLALEVARSVEPAVGQEVRLVRLAGLEGGSRVENAFASALGVLTTGPGSAAADALLAWLADRRVLLVVDNCEHVIDAAASFVERLLQCCPEVRVLATSREALAIPGEVQVAVHPLRVPDEDDDVTSIGEAPAIQLFVERARSVRPGFALDQDSAPVVAHICRALDGVPLAIELAAARTRALTVRMIADRLADRFTLLAAGPRTSERRHQSLLATLDWSHALLSEPERTLLRRLAVFRGTFSLDAAEAVTASGQLGRGEVLDLLFRLVDRSLVVPDPSTGRFRLLATIRDYALIRLAEAGEIESTREAHRGHFTDVALTHGALNRSGGAGWSLMQEEHDNLRAAVDYAVSRAERIRDDEATDAAFTLVNAMIWLWQYNVRHEGVAALTTLLGLGTGSARNRALALQGIAMLHIYYPTPLSRAAARESLTRLEALGDRHAAALSRLLIAWEGQYEDDVTTSWRLVGEVRAAFEAEGVLEREPGTAGLLEYVAGLLLLGQGRFEESVPRWRAAVAQFTRAEDHVIAGAALAHLGVALREGGRLVDARHHLVSAVEAEERHGSLHGQAFSLVHLGHTVLDLDGDEAEALEFLSSGEQVAQRAQNPRCQAWAAWGRARIALAGGDAAGANALAEQAVALLQEREFSWARRRLAALVQETSRMTPSR